MNNKHVEERGYHAATLIQGNIKATLEVAALEVRK